MSNQVTWLVFFSCILPQPKVYPLDNKYVCYLKMKEHVSSLFFNFVISNSCWLEKDLWYYLNWSFTLKLESQLGKQKLIMQKIHDTNKMQIYVKDTLVLMIFSRKNEMFTYHLKLENLSLSRAPTTTILEKKHSIAF